MPHDYPESDRPKYAPSRWGAINNCTRLAAGVWHVSCEGHGGIKLSRERNAAVPQGARCEGGWYEEDCDWALAALVHPDAHTAEQIEAAGSTARNWNPEAYTIITGKPVAEAESIALRKRAFEARTADSFVAVSAFGSWSPFVPEGKVGVMARRKRDGAEQWALVPADAYKVRIEGGYVLDPARDEFIDKPEQTH